MQTNHDLWQTWSDRLGRLGLKSVAASLLDASGPLAVLGAQALYLGQPFLNQALPDRHFQALAELLENQDELRSFTAFLREEKPS